MLIIPVEHKVDWARPPYITLTIIFLNCLIFFAYQSLDNDKLISLDKSYVDKGLYTLELNHYVRYLGRSGSDQYEQIKQLKEAGKKQWLVQQMVHDVGFDHYLDRYVFPRQEAFDDVAVQWEFDRESFERNRDSLSYIQFGIIPAEVTFEGLLGSIFMHGSFDHLLGNMVFLFIFGFSLEAALGKIAYFMMYMTTGVLANLLYVVLESESYVFGVGASGAISGLMGMYLGLYGFRKINFFYSLGFYFNYVKASAALVFPIWVLKELYGAFLSDDHVNYWAHTGGLLSGYILVLVTKGNAVKVDQEYLEKKSEQVDPCEQKWRSLENAVHSLRLDEARRICKVMLDEFPSRNETYYQYLNLLKADMGTSEAKEFVLRVFKLPTYYQNSAIMLDVYKELKSTDAGKALLLNQKLLMFMTKKFSEAGEGDVAEELVLKLMAAENKPPEIALLLFDMGNRFGEDGNQDRKVRYFRKVIEVFPDTKEAELCRAVLG